MIRECGTSGLWKRGLGSERIAESRLGRRSYVAVGRWRVSCRAQLYGERNRHLDGESGAGKNPTEIAPQHEMAYDYTKRGGHELMTTPQKEQEE